VWWECPTCGFAWKSLVKSRVRGTACPVCADRAVKTGYNDLATTDPALAAEWDDAKNGDITPSTVSRNSLRIVWWKDGVGHMWRDRVFNRAVEGAGCKECENEFRASLPRLLISLYAKRLELKVVTGSDKAIGLPLESYIPELALAIETTPEKKTEAEVKDFICKKKGIQMIRVPLRDGDDLADFARRLRQAFQKAHVFLSADEELDVKMLRQRFMTWRKK
jgi:hypothetical protein